MRGRGEAGQLPGDPLLGQPDGHLSRVAAEAACYEPAHTDLRINADGEDPTNLGALIA